jgi:quercetin dioxygenase-like cupin family protein
MPVKAGVIRAGARTTRRGAAETFTGVVFQDPVITAEAPSRLGGSVVTFTPGARTAWHSHPVGQTLFCLSGVGRICFKGEKPQVLNPGDTVNIPPDTMHWHGASPDRLFSHLALSEAGEQGQGAAWGAHVSDAEYNEAASVGLNDAERLVFQLYRVPVFCPPSQKPGIRLGTSSKIMIRSDFCRGSPRRAGGHPVLPPFPNQ